MKYRELAILLPCHSLEDFPLYHTGEDADSLLACWTAIWHPALVASSGSGPKWHRVDLPPEDLQGMLLLVPTVSVSQLPTGFAQRAKDRGALLIRQERNRDLILNKALGQLDGGDPHLDPELVADFMALGYGYLQIQVLTRQMRYSSNLDEVHFFNQLLAGAQAAVCGQVDEARAMIAACFNLLAEERDHYYSVDAYLLDLTLVADSTIGKSLREELRGPTPVNLLLSGEVLEAMAEREPESVLAMNAGLREERLGVIGGEHSELLLPLLSCEGILAELRRGRKTYEQYLSTGVEVFGRRTFGLTPVLPGILEKLNFTGALHATLDDGNFPAATQTKSRWQGVDTGAIDAIAKPPLDANKPETFLSFAQKLGESMDSDHVATLCLAHWPGVTSPWYADLQRCSRYTAALGKFLTASHYFRDTYRPGNVDRFEAGQYKSPYLKQSVIRKRLDPISSTVRSWQRRATADALQALELMASAVTGQVADASRSESERIEGGNETELTPIAAQLTADMTAAGQAFAAAVPRQAGPNQPGCFVLNPCGFARRMGIEFESLPALPDLDKPIVAAGVSGTRQFAVVDVPPMGYVWFTAGNGQPARKKSDPPLAEEDRQRNGTYWLRNEFFEVGIDPVTGALKSLNDYQSRRNRLSQQLAVRIPGGRGQPGDVWRDPDETAQYSVMAADDIRVVVANSALGEIAVRGRLLDREGQPLGAYSQTFRVWRASRVLEIDVELEPLSEPTSDAWNSYYACRFAWNDEAATLAASVNQTRQEVQKQRLEAPLYVEIESGAARTTILTGGLPYHRRVGSRILDSILLVRGERERRFRLGIGIDLPQPLPEAISILTPKIVFEQSAAAPSPPQSWLFHVDTRAVTPTSWSPIVEDGQLRGIRVRLLENTGRSGRIKLSAFRPFVSARQVNFVGETLSECPIVEGRIGIDMSAHEWTEVEGRWS